jgi:DNA mismatch repair ATPase MutS
VLLDEILAGTNSRERHAGTLAVLERLVFRPALTLVATHDLELATLAEGFPGRVRLCHFRDLIQDGRMVFDYALREGPCPTTNALKVMRAAGLAVPEP